MPEFKGEGGMSRWSREFLGLENSSVSCCNDGYMLLYTVKTYTMYNTQSES